MSDMDGVEIVVFSQMRKPFFEFYAKNGIRLRFYSTLTILFS